MIDYMVVDIETVPIVFDNRKVVDYLIRRRFTPGLHPAFSKIVAIGTKTPDAPPIIFVDTDEKQLLDRFWAHLRDKEPRRIVTYNGYRFDIPFIMIRSYINGIQPQLDIDRNRWNMLNEESNHFDCLWALAGMNDEFANISLEVACLIFGIEVPSDYDILTGKDVERAYKRNDIEGIKRHCEYDIMLTEQLYLKLKDIAYPVRRSKPISQKQLDYIIELARQQGIELIPDDIKGWSSQQASKWIDQHKQQKE